MNDKIKFLAIGIIAVLLVYSIVITIDMFIVSKRDDGKNNIEPANNTEKDVLVGSPKSHRIDDFTVGIYNQHIRDSVHVVFKDEKGVEVGEETYNAGDGWMFFTYELWFTNNGEDKKIFWPTLLYDENNIQYDSFYPDEWGEWGVIAFLPNSIIRCVCIDEGYNPYIQAGESRELFVIYKMPITAVPKWQGISIFGDGDGYAPGASYYFQEGRWKDL